MPGIIKRALFEMDERTQIQRILTHGEKSAVHMADGYARASGRPGLCMAQTVGAANLAAGLREPVDKPSEIGIALEQAFAADRPVVVDVATEVMAMAPLAIP